MKFYSLFFVCCLLVLSCSQEINKSLNHHLVIISKKEIISDLDSLENNLFKYVNDSTAQDISIQDIFDKSWLSSIKADYSFDNSISVVIKEHHPIADLGKDRYLTQKGKLINPKGKFKKLSLVKIKGPEDTSDILINYSRELQARLNKLDLKVISFELKNKDQLRAKDNSGTEYIFSHKEFRVQLERLEDYISFELNSGTINNIRYMDFRYNNAIAVYHS